MDARDRRISSNRRSASIVGSPVSFNSRIRVSSLAIRSSASSTRRSAVACCLSVSVIGFVNLKKLVCEERGRRGFRHFCQPLDPGPGSTDLADAFFVARRYPEALAARVRAPSVMIDSPLYGAAILGIVLMRRSDGRTERCPGSRQRPADPWQLPSAAWSNSFSKTIPIVDRRIEIISPRECARPECPDNSHFRLWHCPEVAPTSGFRPLTGGLCCKTR